MEIPDQFLEQLQAWEKKQLSSEEVLRFEAAVAEGGEWHELYRQYIRARKAIDLSAEEALKSQWRKDFFHEAPKPKPIKLWPFWAVAAGALLLIGFYLFSPRANSADALYQQYTEHLVLSPGQRGTGNSNELLQEANSLFNQEKYQDAIPLLEQILTDSAFLRRDYAHLHLGLCYLNLGEFEKAVSNLTQVDTQSAFRYDSMWYQALIAWKQGDKKGAKALFEKLRRESKTWLKQAGEFLEAMGDEG